MTEYDYISWKVTEYEYEYQIVQFSLNQLLQIILCDNTVPVSARPRQRPRRLEDRGPE